MPFDLEALLQSPGFQGGLGMLGAANPGKPSIMEAYKVLQSEAAQRQAQIQAQQEMAYKQAQIEQAKAQIEQSGARTKVYQQDVATKEQSNALLQQQIKAGMAFLSGQGLGGQGAPAGQPQEQAPQLQQIAQPVQAQPQSPFQAQPSNPTAVDYSQSRPMISPAAQKAADEESILMVQSELNKEKNPMNQEALKRELERLKVATGGSTPANITSIDPLRRLEIQTGATLKRPTLEPYRAAQIAGAVIDMGSKPGAGLSELGKALTPTTEAPGSFKRDAYGNLTQTPNNPLDIRKTNLEELKVNSENANRASEMKARDVLNQERMQKQTAQKATDKATFDMVNSNADSAIKLTDELLKSPGLNAIFGRTGGLISPRLLTNPEAMNASANLETLKAKVMNDTLQAIRQGSQNGASGYGSLDKNEGDNLKNMVASLSQAQTPAKVREHIQQINEHMKTLKQRAATVYESTHNSSVYSDELPAGSKQIGTSKGVPVYRTPDGKQVQVN